jgi:EAL domain-containing protein (putative c-di-GMP-specific phosphodiesterase class I)
MVVETLVGLSKRLGLSVVAEGVEDDVQLAAARRAGADLVQGYRVAAPLDVAGLESFISSWGRTAATG